MSQPGTKPTSPSTAIIVALLVWSLLPSAAMWVGLYTLKSAMWAYALYHGIFLLPAIIWGRKYWTETFKMPKFGHCVNILIVALIFSVITVAAYELLGTLVLSDEKIAILLDELGIATHNLVLFGLYAVIVNPLLEEIFWRGIVFNVLNEKFSNENVPSERVSNEQTNSLWKHFPIVWSSITYALFHYLIFRLVLFPLWAEIGIIMLAVYGGVLTVVYKRTGSIITTSIAHGLWTDLACIALLIDFYRRMSLH